MINNNSAWLSNLCIFFGEQLIWKPKNSYTFKNIFPFRAAHWWENFRCFFKSLYNFEFFWVGNPIFGKFSSIYSKNGLRRRFRDLLILLAVESQIKIDTFKIQCCAQFPIPVLSWHHKMWILKQLSLYVRIVHLVHGASNSPFGISIAYSQSVQNVDCIIL